MWDGLFQILFQVFFHEKSYVEKATLIFPLKCFFLEELFGLEFLKANANFIIFQNSLSNDQKMYTLTVIEMYFKLV